jgi:hypothetical protein
MTPEHGYAQRPGARARALVQGLRPGERVHGWRGAAPAGLGEGMQRYRGAGRGNVEVQGCGLRCRVSTGARGAGNATWVWLRLGRCCRGAGLSGGRCTLVQGRRLGCRVLAGAGGAGYEV